VAEKVGDEANPPADVTPSPRVQVRIPAVTSPATTPSPPPSDEFDPDEFKAAKAAMPSPEASAPTQSQYPSWLENQRREERAAREQVIRGIKQMSSEPPTPGDQGPKPEFNGDWWTHVKGLGNVALGTLGWVTSPVKSALDTAIEQPIAGITGSKKAGEYASLAAGLAIPGYGLRGLAVREAPLVTSAAEKAELARRELAAEHGIDLSKGQAAEDLEKIRFEDMAARGAYGKPAQEEAAPFFERQYGQIGEAGKTIGEGLARDKGVVGELGVAGAVVNSELGTAAQQARQAVQEAESTAQREAEAARQATSDRLVAAQQAAEQEAAAHRAIAEDQGRAIAEAIRGANPEIENAREAGEIVGQTVRQRAAQERQAYQNLYGEAFGLPGQFHAGAFEGVGQRIKGYLTLGDEPVIIDDVTTPVAFRAIRDVDGISSLRIQNRAGPLGQPNPENIVAVDLRGVDQARKRLVAYYRQARQSGNAADARATGRILDGFDDQVENAISSGLFSGDERALTALQEARGAYRRYAQAYRPQQSGDDVGNAMRRIIDRNATPEEIANMVIGSGKIGNAGLPVRIADRLENVLGADSEAWNSIRQAMFRRASEVHATDGSLDPIRGATRLMDFTDSSLARRMFTPEELAAMQGHAQGVRDLDRIVAQLPTTREAAQAAEQVKPANVKAAIAALPSTQKAERVRAAYQDLFGGDGIGGAQAAAFRRIVEGTASPEETVNALFSAIGSGNPGNVSRLIGAVQRIVGPDSDAMETLRRRRETDYCAATCANEFRYLDCSRGNGESARGYGCRRAWSSSASAPHCRIRRRTVGAWSHRCSERSSHGKAAP
jgi:hypothetical protein